VFGLIVAQIQEVNSKPLLRKKSRRKPVQNGVNRIVQDLLDKRKCIISTAVRRPKNVSVRQEDVGSVKMKVADVLKKLEKHEKSCDKRYEQIQKQLDRLDLKIWGLAVLIIFAPFINRVF
tara:strand:+ start:430 stop:789 length:360 start_codon:yes stop_codon:yes gene_type:complete